jgi:hypothetical protein
MFIIDLLGSGYELHVFCKKMHSISAADIYLLYNLFWSNKRLERWYQ